MRLICSSTLRSYGRSFGSTPRCALRLALLLAHEVANNFAKPLSLASANHCAMPPLTGEARSGLPKRALSMERSGRALGRPESHGIVWKLSQRSGELGLPDSISERPGHGRDRILWGEVVFASDRADFFE